MSDNNKKENITPARFIVFTGVYFINPDADKLQLKIKNIFLSRVQGIKLLDTKKLFPPKICYFCHKGTVS